MLWFLDADHPSIFGSQISDMHVFYKARSWIHIFDDWIESQRGADFVWLRCNFYNSISVEEVRNGDQTIEWEKSKNDVIN